MVREHGGDGEIVVPPTIHALLQARIDSLDGDVRVVMERGSVEGEVFHRGSVAVLAPDPVRPAVESHLATLVRKELIRSTSPTFPEDEGFRFRHLLIRDAAYESLPKATRAELHERFADWLATHDLSSATRSSATTSSRRIATGSSSIRAIRRSRRSRERASERLACRRTCGAMDRGDWGAASEPAPPCATISFPQAPTRAHALAPELSIALQETGEIERACEALAAEGRRRRVDPVIAGARRGRSGRHRLISTRALVAWRPGHGATRRGRSSRPPATISGSLSTGARAATTSGGVCRCAESGECMERGIEHARAVGADRIAWELRSYDPQRARARRRPRSSAALPKRRRLSTRSRVGIAGGGGCAAGHRAQLLACQRLDRRRLERASTGACETFRDAGLRRHGVIGADARLDRAACGRHRGAGASIRASSARPTEISRPSVIVLLLARLRSGSRTLLIDSGADRRRDRGSVHGRARAHARRRSRQLHLPRLGRSRRASRPRAPRRRGSHRLGERARTRGRDGPLPHASCVLAWSWREVAAPGRARRTSRRRCASDAVRDPRGEGRRVGRRCVRAATSQSSASRSP